MKLRTSFFNPTVFKKDVTRFAPSWALYSIFLLMGMMLCFSNDMEYYRATNVADCIAGMAVVNICYGLLNAQLLFGDLYNARLCNALHAMPLRRECWFSTHVAAGLAFSFVPNLVMSLIALPMLGGGWSVALWWLLGASLQYIFFFGLATLAALCVGNRFAMALVYAIVNFLSLLIYWFYQSLYEPLLYGVRIDGEPFLKWSPVCHMIENYELVDVEAVKYGTTNSDLVKSVTLGEGWGYLALCACIGAAFIAIALLLYRRRKLESAGDFMAVRALEPVFLVLYTLTVGAFFHMFSDALLGMENDYFFLALGLMVGFFTGMMLLKRTVKVFSLKSLLGFVIMGAVLALSLVLTHFDVLGVTRRIPDTEDVKTVRISDSYYAYETSGIALEGDAEVDAIREMHRMILEGQTESVNTHPYDDIYYVRVSLDYYLENGTRMTRYYRVAADSPVGQLVKGYYTRPEYVLGISADGVQTFADSLTYLYIRNDTEDGTQDPTSPLAEDLVAAIIADCEAGNMAQNYGFHPDEDGVSWIEFNSYDYITREYSYYSITLYPCCENTIAVLLEYGFPVYHADYMEKTYTEISPY